MPSLLLSDLLSPFKGFMKYKKLILTLKLLYRILALGILCLFANTNEIAQAETSIKIIQNGITKGQLAMQFKVDELFDEKVTKFLKRGFTIRLDYNIELWRKRGYWFDSLSNQQSISYEILFDVLEKRFLCRKMKQDSTIESRTEKQLNKLIQWLTEQDSLFIIAPLDELSPGSQYYYNIEIIIATLTADNIKDLQRWMGEFDKRSEQPSSFARTSFKIVADFLSSRNHKRISIRSESFSPYSLPRIQSEKRQNL